MRRTSIGTQLRPPVTSVVSQVDYLDANHPYRWRTFIRVHLPWFLIDLGLADKALDCEAAGADHWWYNIDGRSSGCYHCKVEREGRLWESNDEPSRVGSEL
jgi:hypothetical protein